MPKQYEWPDGITGDRRYVIASIIWTIYDNSPITSEDGRATAKLLALVTDAGIEISGGWLNKTLNDLSRHGDLGHFVDRDISGKRTYGIKCVRDPETYPFPPDPRRPRSPVRPPIEDDIDVDDEIVDPNLFDLREDDEMADDEVGDIDVTVPGVAIEAVPAISKADKILYVVSLLNEILTEELTAPQRRFEDEIGARLTAVNTIIEENQKLKKENDELRGDKRKLAQALEQANTIMRDHSRRATNGQREELVTS